MNVLMVGAGAVGGYVGARLAQAGRDVEFLVRPARAAELTEHGLLIDGGSQTEAVTVSTRTASALARPYDLVIVAVKSPALAAAIDDIRPAVGAGTSVLPFLNGMSHIETLTRAFGRDRVLGGVLKIVTDLAPDGAIRELARGGSIQVGELDGPVSHRASEIAEVLAVPTFEVSTSTDIMAAMWAKWVFIATIGAVTSIARGSIAEATEAIGPGFARATLDEIAGIAQACGYALDPGEYDRVLAAVTAPGAGTTSSLSRDLVGGKPTEVEAVLGDLATRARAHGLSIPHLEAAVLTLRVHNTHLRRRD